MSHGQIYEGDSWKHTPEPRPQIPKITRADQQRALNDAFIAGTIDLDDWRIETDKLSNL